MPTGEIPIYMGSGVILGDDSIQAFYTDEEDPQVPQSPHLRMHDKFSRL